MSTLLPQPDPRHQITVTGGGPFGRAWFDCTCGIAQTHASKRAANQAALRHYAAIYPQSPARDAPGSAVASHSG